MRAHGAAHNAAPIVAQEIWPEPVMRASKNAPLRPLRWQRSKFPQSKDALWAVPMSAREAIPRAARERGIILRRASLHPSNSHDSDDFMSRNSRVLNAGHGSVLCNRIAVTDSTSLHLDSYRSGTWLRNFAFHNFKWSIRPSDLNRAHFWHIPPAAVFFTSPAL